MAVQQLSLIKGDSVDNNTEYRDSLPVNLIVIPKKVLGADSYLINWYGLDLFSTAQGVDRGAIWVSNEDLEGHYRVSGTKFTSVDSDGSVTVLGEVGSGGQVAMDYSFNNIAIVAGLKLYYYNKTDGLRLMTDLDIGSPVDVVYVDGYFFLTDGKGIYHSDITNEESFLPLDFGNAQFMPDASRGLGKNEDNEVLVFGSFSVEYFINVGTNNFAFQRLNQKAQKIGILGTHCKREMNGKWYTLSRRKESAPSFHIISLGNEQAISTRETDQVLSTYTHDELESVTIDTMVRDNMKFVLFHLSNHTFLFNETVAEVAGTDNAWAILKSDANGDRTYRAKNIILDPRNAKWVAGDKLSDSLGVVSSSSCTHYGEIAEWIADTAFINLNGKVVNQINLETIPGIAPDNDATVEISITTNGRTRSDGRWVKMGKNRDYNDRFIVRQPFRFIRHYVSMRFRGASRSRMSISGLTMVAS